MQDQLLGNSLAEVGLHKSMGAAVEDDGLRTRQLSQLQLVWIRFRHHRLAMVGAVVLVLWVLVAIVGPFLMVEDPYNALTYTADNQNLAPTLHTWNWILGTDTDGHSVLSQIVWGARVSLAVGIFSSLFTTLIGLIVGAIAGYFGHITDTIMMRVTDVFLTLPFFPVLLIVTAFVGQGSVPLIVVIFSFFGWPAVARLVRGSYLSLRNQEFVEAARAVGVPNRRIIFRHMLPSALRPVIVVSTLNVSAFIVAEAAIDFLGVGISYPTPSWGNILAGSQNAMSSGNWWWPVFPGLAIVMTVLAVNFLGDGLGDALDVRSKG